MHSTRLNKGILSGIAAYALWGLFPIYWKQLDMVSAFQVIGHRIVWSFVFLAAYLVVTRQWMDFRSVAFRPKTLGIYSVAAVLLSLNWLIYVWGVNSNFIVETSLGYFINPLLSVLLGVIFLRERLRPLQWLPVGIAALGVGYLTVAYGHLPWIAITLAFSFAFYGFIKKLSPLGSLYGLTLETGVVFPVALVYLVFVGFNGTGSFLREGTVVNWFLLGSGIATTIPLLLFASAARRIPLTIVGLLQYIAPTIQFLIGIFIYKEPFDHTHLIGFSIVWVALAIFAIESYFSKRTPPIPEPGD